MELRLDPEKVQKMKVWILIPAAGDKINATFAACLVRLLGQLRIHGINGELRFMPGDSLVTRARNNLASIFYKDSTDDHNHYSLWIDSDILFDPQSVLQMLSLDMDFVAAPYTRKGLHLDRMHAAASLGWKAEDITRVAGTPNVNFLMNAFQISEPVPVREAGSGFWLVKRKVFRMMAEGLDIEYKRNLEETAHYGEGTAHDFFRVGVWPETREYLSEDWWFCREWRNLGGTVNCCFWIKTHHIGPYMYPMDMDAVVGLLSQTGGYVHGETWGNKSNGNVGASKESTERENAGAVGATAPVGCATA